MCYGYAWMSVAFCLQSNGLEEFMSEVLLEFGNQLFRNSF